MRPFIFLDRDGTVNVEKHFLHTVEEFEFEPGSIRALKLLQDNGYGLAVISNQSGIGRGYFSREDADRVNDHMKSELEKKGILIDGIYICPHAPEENCRCRKPGTALFLKAAEELDIDLKNSYAVGDRIRDIMPAMELGFGFGLVRTGHGAAEDTREIEPEKIFDDLSGFAEAVIKKKI